MKLEEALPHLREGSIIYRINLPLGDRTYYYHDGKEPKCFGLTRSSKLLLLPFSLSKYDLFASDWTLCTNEEEAKFATILKEQ